MNTREKLKDPRIPYSFHMYITGSYLYTKKKDKNTLSRDERSYFFLPPPFKKGIPIATFDVLGNSQLFGSFRYAVTENSNLVQMMKNL